MKMKANGKISQLHDFNTVQSGFEIKQLYQSALNSGSQTSKAFNGHKVSTPLITNIRDNSNRSSKDIKDAKQNNNMQVQAQNLQRQVIQRVSPRIDSNILTKEYLRQQIKEKEQQLQQQINERTLSKNEIEPQSVYFGGKSEPQPQASEISNVMLKYNQYFSQNQAKISNGSQLQLTQKKTDFQVDNKTPISQMRNNGGILQGSKSQSNMLDQFVTKVNQGFEQLQLLDDNSLSNLNLQMSQINTTNRSQNVRVQKDKFQITKPLTPIQNTSKLLDSKLSYRPLTSTRSNYKVFYTIYSYKQAMNLGNLMQSQPNPKPELQYLTSNSELQKKLSPRQIPLVNQIHQHPNKPLSDIQGYYLHPMQQSFKKPFTEDYFNLIYRDHFYQTYQGISFAQFLKPVDPDDVKNKQILLKKSETYENKITLVFDLDETLVHCNENTTIPSDVKLRINLTKSETIIAGVNIRPGAVELLKDLSKHFEIIVFTASHSCYAERVLDYLDPQGILIQHRLFRESCCMTTGGMYTKDLRIFADRSLDQLVLIDNAAYSYAWQIENGIPIIPFYNNKADKELEVLGQYLKGMIGVRDVRQYNKQNLKLQSFNEPEGPQQAFQKVFGYGMDI